MARAEAAAAAAAARSVVAATEERRAAVLALAHAPLYPSNDGGEKSGRSKGFGASGRQLCAPDALRKASSGSDSEDSSGSPPGDLTGDSVGVILPPPSTAQRSALADRGIKEAPPVLPVPTRSPAIAYATAVAAAEEALTAPPQIPAQYINGRPRSAMSFSSREGYSGDPRRPSSGTAFSLSRHSIHTPSPLNTTGAAGVTSGATSSVGIGLGLDTVRPVDG